MIINKNEKDSVVKISSILKKGGVVIIPTDTVYGFSGIVDTNSFGTQSAFCTDKKIRQIKGRAETKPLIQLIAKPEDILLYTDDVIPESVFSKWPGALTVIVHLKNNIPMSKELPTVAFRCPGDKWLRQIIEQCGSPIFSTSVNRSGKPVLETVEQIKAEFEDEVSAIVDDGDKKGALPSTLISIDGQNIQVLRQGSVLID